MAVKGVGIGGGGGGEREREVCGLCEDSRAAAGQEGLTHAAGL